MQSKGCASSQWNFFLRNINALGWSALSPPKVLAVKYDGAIVFDGRFHCPRPISLQPKSGKAEEWDSLAVSFKCLLMADKAVIRQSSPQRTVAERTAEASRQRIGTLLRDFKTWHGHCQRNANWTVKLSNR